MQSTTGFHVFLFSILVYLYVAYMNLLSVPRPVGSLKHAILKGMPILFLIRGVYSEVNSSQRFPHYRQHILLGLLMSLVGDMFMVWEVECFIPGLLAFAVAHVLYIRAFGWRSRQLAFAIFCYATGFTIYAVLLHQGIHELHMNVAVIFYCIIIFTMIWRSFAAFVVSKYRLYAAFACIGAIVFAVSDAVIAMNKFYLATPTSHFLVMSTYYSAQALISISVLEYPETASNLKVKKTQ